MSKTKLKTNLINLIEYYGLNNKDKYKLIVITGLLGDFDSLEYAQKLSKFIELQQEEKIEMLFLGIGSKIGKEKFSNFTGIPTDNLKITQNNDLHNKLGIHKGLDVGLGTWINMLLMLSGIYSSKTIKEVIRGYTGDKDAKEIFEESNQVNILNIFKFSGNLFKTTFGEGYLRPFELATYRLINMIEILGNWNDYILDANLLPQRGATFLLNPNGELIYDYFAKDILSYSEDMREPLKFLSKNLK